MKNTEIGDAIKGLRKVLGGISQERFARRLGTTTRTVARWEASEALPSGVLIHLRNIALAAYAWDAADFFTEKLHQLLDPCWRDEDFDDFAIAMPRNAEEQTLVDELLKRYRTEDPSIQPIAEQLHAWSAERAQQRAQHRAQKEKTK
jgi:transcriptional regulator with XRE-family HTH domain